MKSLLEIALSQIHIQEFKGEKDNPEVLKYFNDLGFNGSKLKDETSWCAAFINWCLKQACLEHQNKLTARSFLEIGKEVQDPQAGDIVVFWRESKKSWKGHVAIYCREDKNFIYCLGGNQNNEVNISRYYKNRVLGYRRFEK